MKIHSESMNTALRWKLRALRRDIEPSRDLWPGIAARLNRTAHPPRRSRRMLPLGLAAVLVLAAFGLHGPLRPPAPEESAATVAMTDGRLIQAQVELLVQEYQTALDAIHVHRTIPDDTALALLDASAEHIRTALMQEPHAHFLLIRLHRVYARRLALTRQLSTV